MLKLRDGFLKSIYSHTHRHYFGNDVDPAERAEWLNQILLMAERAGIVLMHRETSDGFEFGFPDELHWTAFTANFEALGGETKRCGHTHRFNGYDMQDEWTFLARSWLDRLGIEYQVESYEGEVRFEFGSIADRTAFHSLVEELDYAADAMVRAGTFRARNEHAPSVASA